MMLYRVVKCRYADDLTANAASEFGGRWTSEGKQVLYLSSSRALATLEVLLHLPPLMVPNDYCLTEIEVPDDNITNISADELPANWKNVPFPRELKTIGDRFLKQQVSLLMRVPSPVIATEFNYLINVMHPDIKRVKILSKETFSFEGYNKVSNFPL